jgi:hypothetical protein
MIGERQRDAMPECRLGQAPIGVEQDAAIAAEGQLLAIKLTVGRDQGRLAMDIERIALLVVARFRFDPVDPDRDAAPALGREIARLAPFQRLLERTDAGCFRRRLKDKPPQFQELRPGPRRIAGKHGFDRRIGEAVACGSLALCARLRHGEH